MPDFRLIKQQIKNYISIFDIYERYVGGSRNQFNRYKCPFNDKENRNNFGIKGKMWHCFSCGCGGDEITLVQKLFDLSAQDAMLKIAQDFNLVTEVDYEMSKKLYLEEQRKKRQREKDKRYAELITKKQVEVYDMLLDKEHKLEEIIRKNLPTKKNIEFYGYSSYCEKCMNALKDLHFTRIMIDVVGETANSKYEDELLFPAYTSEERHNRMVRTINKIIKGELEI